MDWLKNLVLHFVPPLQNGNDFSSGYSSFQQYIPWHNTENTWKIIINLAMLIETKISLLVFGTTPIPQ